jgi:hypothetical protein
LNFCFPGALMYVCWHDLCWMKLFRGTWWAKCHTKGEILRDHLCIFLGVCLVANIGIQTVAFKWCLLGAAVSTPALLMKDQSIIFAALFSSLSASWKTKWNIEKKPRKGFLKRCVVLTFCGMLYLSLWTDVIYFNLHVTTSDGKKVPVNQVVNDFVESSAWKSLKKNMYDLYEHCQQDWKDCRNTVYELFEHCQKLGWLKCYDHLVHHLHPTEGTSAYKVSIVNYIHAYINKLIIR